MVPAMGVTAAGSTSPQCHPCRVLVAIPGHSLGTTCSHAGVWSPASPRGHRHVVASSPNPRHRYPVLPQELWGTLSPCSGPIPTCPSLTNPAPWGGSQAFWKKIWPQVLLNAWSKQSRARSCAVPKPCHP